MFARMTRNKSSVPHQIIQAQFGASPLQLDTTFQVITYLHRVKDFGSSHDGHLRLPWLALSSSMALSDEGDQICWYSHLSSWLSRLGINIDRLPPFQYSLGAPSSYTSPTEQEVNQIIREDLLQLHTFRTWLLPRKLLVKLDFYYQHYLHISQEGFITPQGYTQVHLPRALRISLCQFRVSSHKL